jgi:hypothetical protein
MKRLYTTFTLCTALTFAQFSAQAQSIVSITDGNASNPFTWDCTCIPLPTMDITIAHDVVLDNDWAQNGGSLTINSGASLIGNTADRGLAVTAGTFTNNGTTSIPLVATTGGTIVNNSNFTIDVALYNSTDFTNNGSLLSLDSLWNDLTGDFDNTSGSVMQAGQFYNTAAFVNSGQVTSDSIGNTLTFTNNGTINTFVLGTTGGPFTNNAIINVTNNFGNAGNADNAAGSLLEIGNDFINGDTILGGADFNNDGVVGVAMDYYNYQNITGSGIFCVQGYSLNTGSMTGTFDFCDNTNGPIDLNIGTIGGSITYCSSPCAVGVEEANVVENITVYPNPFTDHAIIEVEMTNYNQRKNIQLNVYDLSGRVVYSKTGLTNNRFIVPGNELSSGMYSFELLLENTQLGRGKLIAR